MRLMVVTVWRLLWCAGLNYEINHNPAQHFVFIHATIAYTAGRKLSNPTGHILTIRLTQLKVHHVTTRDPTPPVRI